MTNSPRLSRSQGQYRIHYMGLALAVNLLYPYCIRTHLSGYLHLKKTHLMESDGRGLATSPQHLTPPAKNIFPPSSSRSASSRFLTANQSAPAFNLHSPAAHYTANAAGGRLMASPEPRGISRSSPTTPPPRAPPTPLFTGNTGYRMLSPGWERREWEKTWG